VAGMNWRAGGREGRPTPKDSWRTPPELYARLDEEFHFGLDAACTRENCLAPAGLYDGEYDALAVPWVGFGAVWLNPPYSNVRPWLRKAREAGRRVPVVCLVTSDTGCRWWQEYVAVDASEVRFLVGRMRFLRPDGTTNASRSSRGEVARASALVVYGPAGGPPRYSYMETRIAPQKRLALAADESIEFRRGYDHQTGGWTLEVKG